MELKDLCGQHILKGVEYGCREEPLDWAPDIIDHTRYLKFNLDGTVYCALEDVRDEYRSVCRQVIKEYSPCKLIIPDTPVIAKMKEVPGDYVLQLYDAKTAELILEVGTEAYNDWYPICIFYWNPEGLSCNADKRFGVDTWRT